MKFNIKYFILTSHLIKIKGFAAASFETFLIIEYIFKN
jgi:hypothetical protein